MDPFLEVLAVVSFPALVGLDVVVLCELGVVDEFEVESCASMNGTVAAAKANDRKMLVFFMGKSPGWPYSGLSTS